MEITKLGHCCLIIKVNGLRILTDPGMWTIQEHASVKDIDIILITHDHPDHIHLESINTILANNPNAKIYTNSGVGKSLSEQGIAFEKLEGTSKTKVKDIELEAFDCDHEMIYPIVPLPQNTGYWITDKLFYPGDSLTKPGKSVELLALPVAGPWMTIQQGLDYAKEVKPKQCFPVHDGFVLEESLQLYHGLPQKVLVEAEIEFIPLKAGESLDF